MTTTNTRRTLARVLRNAREMGWTRSGNTWTHPVSGECVAWNPKTSLLRIARIGAFDNRRMTAEVEVSSLREALDTVSALGMIPLVFSPSYLDGSACAQAATERRLHEHYSKHFEREFGQTYAYVLDLAEFVDHEHEFRSATGCHPQPGADCVEGCEACGLLADLSDEARAELDQRKAAA